MTLDGKRILIFVGDIYEDLELWYPKLRMEEAGAAVTIAEAMRIVSEDIMGGAAPWLAHRLSW